jgi:hypothetical protein
MISRMRETGIELAIVEGSAGSLPILVSWERNGPPLSLTFTIPASRQMKTRGAASRSFACTRPSMGQMKSGASRRVALVSMKRVREEAFRE